MRVVLLLLMITSVAAHAAEMSRPMSEMHGGCKDFKLNLTNELKAWQEPAVKAQAEIPNGKKAELALLKQEKVTFLKAPGKSFPVKGESFGGVFPFQVQKAGKYRISAGSKIWFDVVEVSTKKFVDASEFEMQTGCDKIFKTVVFELAANTKYALQLSSNAKPSAEFLITAE